MRLDNILLRTSDAKTMSLAQQDVISLIKNEGHDAVYFSAVNGVHSVEHSFPIRGLVEVEGYLSIFGYLRTKHETHIVCPALMFNDHDIPKLKDKIVLGGVSYSISEIDYVDSNVQLVNNYNMAMFIDFFVTSLSAFSRTSNI
jgi:hypothetical protein